MAIEKELGLKLVYKIAEEELKCDVCGKVILVGQPYALKSNPQVREGRIFLITEHECLTTCSVVEGFKNDVQRRI